MKVHRTLLLAVIVSFLGFLAGSLGPVDNSGQLGIARASGYASYWFHVPVRAVGATNAKLNCGWHWAACTFPGDDGRALDWSRYQWNGSTSNTNVYMRGAGYHPDYTNPVSLAFAWLRYAPGEFVSCQNNYIADFYDLYSNWLISLGYTHTQTPQGAFFDIYYNNSASAYTSYAILKMQTVDNDPNCNVANNKWTGAHLHAWECSCAPYGVGSNGWPPPGTFPTSNTASGPYSVGTWVHFFQFWF